jgi:hypothetical protein
MAVKGSEKNTGEDFHGFANRKALEYASQNAHPIADPERFAYFYWAIMSNYGFRPYIPGMTTY